MATNVNKQNQADANHSLTNEIVGIILLAVSILLALCLFTYNAQDPSLNTASREAVRNFAGGIGANVASLLFQTIGVTAFAFPIFLLWTAWRTFWAESLRIPLARVVGLIFFVISFAALLPLVGFTAFFDGSVPAGGMIGTFASQAVAAGLGRIGAGVLFVAVGAAAFLLVTGVSYAPLIVQLKIWYDAAVERFRVWREHEKIQAKLRLERRRAAQSALPNDFTQTVGAAQNSKSKVQSPLTAVEKDSENSIVETRKGFDLQTLKSGFSNFLRRIQQPPDFVRAGDKNSDAENLNDSGANAAENSDDTPTISSENAARREIKPRKLERILDDENESATDDGEAIPIQPLKSGDAEFDADAEFERENSISAIRPPQSAAPAARIEYGDYILPPSDFLNSAPARIQHADDELLNIAKTLEAKCQEFKAAGKVVNICPGPVVTTYEYKLNTGVQFKTIANLVDDLCLGLQAESVRIDRIPGKAFVGVEVPNPRRETIFLREVLESRSFAENNSLLTIALGKTVDGLNYTADLSKMPHLLIAGATGAGKSVGVNSLVVSILYKAKPDEVKFIMVDPKQVELNLYADIPHLATPIITDPKRAAIALKWAVAEMERRYKMLSSWYTRNIEGYNAEVLRRNFVEEFDENGEAWKPLPYLVIIIDEFADLMITSRAEVEESIMRLVAKARAVGIHLILATQRPSVDVVTGVIKANFPCRIAFRVSSGIDSKTIINTVGAEHLLGRGDMLFLPPGASKLLRVHGAFVEESEIQKIVEHIKAQGLPDYDTTITQTEEEAGGMDFDESESDELFEQALRICVEMKRASTSVLQRRLSIGYGRAAKIIDAMERAGYVGQADGASKPRPVLNKAVERVMEWNEMEAGTSDF